MQAKKAELLRYSLQFISFVSFTLFLAGLSYPLGLDNLVLQWISRLDPWLLLSQLRWQQEVPAWVWLPLLTMGSVLLWGRVFCGWICPFGAFLTLADKFGRVVLKRFSSIRTKVLHAVQPMRGYWLLLLVIIFLLGSNWVMFLTPFALLGHEIVRLLQGQIPWVLIGITAGTLLFSRCWCSVLCPTGALLAAAARLRLFRYRLAGNCLHCGKCIRVCPVGARPSDTGVSQEGCLACGDCRKVCPTKAIQWQRSFWRGKGGRPDFAAEIAATKRQASRRQFFKAAFSVAAAAAFWQKTVWAAENALRPPGALPEPEFTAVCNRCARCIKVCPSNALIPMPITGGLANFETPYIIPRRNRCDLCLSCQQVCPTGAISQVPLEKIRMGKAVINQRRCIAWNDGKLCYICGEQCPVLAITADEYHRPAVLPDKCAGCGSCENACPVDGEAAIRVYPH